MSLETRNVTQTELYSMSLKLGPIRLPQEATDHQENCRLQGRVKMSSVTITNSITIII